MGDKRTFTFKLKKDEEIKVVEFVKAQSNFNDTIRYLIQKEIAENGIRNLQNFIPGQRNNSYFSNLKNEKPSFQIREISRIDIKENSSKTNKEVNEIESANRNEKVGIGRNIDDDIESRIKIKEKDIEHSNIEDDDIPDCYC